MEKTANWASLLEAPPWFLPHIILIGCQIAFAVVQVISKAALRHVPPFVFAMLRLLGAVPVLWAIARTIEPGPAFFPFRTFLVFVFLGFCTFLNQGLIFVGVHLVGPDVVSIFQPTIPVYVALLSALLGMERLTLLKAGGIALAVGGAVIMLDVSHLDLHSSHTIGLLIMNLQVMAYALFIVALGRQLQVIPRPFTVFAWASTFALLFLVLAAIPSVHSVEWSTVPLNAWLTLAYCSFGVSVGAHGMVSWAVRHISSTLPSLYTCLQPLFATALAALIYGDELATLDALGMALIIPGMILTVYAKHYHDKDQAELARDDVRSSDEVALVAPSHCGKSDEATELSLLADASVDSDAGALLDVFRTK